MNKLKKIMSYVLVTIAMCTLSVLLFRYFGSIETHEEQFFRLLKEEIGVEFSMCEIIEEKDSHRGTFGEGHTRRVYDCSDGKIQLEALKKMEQLPLNEDLQYEIYNDAIKPEIMQLPKIENGYYYFIDNLSQSNGDVSDINSDEKLLDRPSTNYTLGIYDLDTNLFYYLEVDT